MRLLFLSRAPRLYTSFPLRFKFAQVTGILTESDGMIVGYSPPSESGSSLGLGSEGSVEVAGGCWFSLPEQPEIARAIISIRHRNRVLFIIKFSPSYYEI